MLLDFVEFVLIEQRVGVSFDSTMIFCRDRFD